MFDTRSAFPRNLDLVELGLLQLNAILSETAEEIEQTFL